MAYSWGGRIGSWRLAWAVAGIGGPLERKERERRKGERTGRKKWRESTVETDCQGRAWKFRNTRAAVMLAYLSLGLHCIDSDKTAQR